MKKRMKVQTGTFLATVGQRLALIREELRLTRGEMALKLGLNQTTYYKNETGFFLPCLDTLARLHKDLDISLDWVLFGSEPMHNKDKQPIIAPDTITRRLENKLPGVKGLLNSMDQDPMLLHEIMLYYYRYKKNQETSISKPAVPVELHAPGEPQVE
jgi:transcriptional regulator with XRE-family HTH domain